ncbi:MAG: prolyl oligopeptidase family serine peptidase [Acidobacteria bacterium]|nr:prolyl oligopeptidase family serine peptidase [Acidobacteriota bacterium]
MSPRHALLLALAVASATSGAGPWDVKALQQTPRVEWLDSTGPLRSLLYEGEPYHGKPTRVFAYYAPARHVSGPAPGVVLVHGGGGKAFRDWAWMWAERGYSAIAMDLAGHGADGERLPDGGPDQGPKEKFDDIADGLREAWTYHAIADVMRALSVLQAQPGVDPERIGVTGISWGGYLTSIVVGVDDRIKAAVPVYGCGFIYRNSPWVKNIDDLTPDLRRAWIDNFDPSKHLPHASAPILWVTRTQDFHYRMDNYQAGYRLPQGPRVLSITTDRQHSHPAGWAPPEIELFFDHYLKGEAPLATVGETQTQGGQATATVQAAVELTAAVLAYTRDDPTSHESLWETAPARLEAGKVSAPLPEPAPRAYFLIVSDARGARISSPCVGCSP